MARTDRLQFQQGWSKPLTPVPFLGVVAEPRVVGEGALGVVAVLVTEGGIGVP